MHDIEPHYNWRHLYTAEEDENSPFYGREYSEFTFSDRVYDYLLHPQWDDIGSPTLFIKILYIDYEEGSCILEFIGEWNDCLHNDIMILKREIIDELSIQGIKKFVLIGENVLNFHYSDECYYEEWMDDIEEDGWIVAINFRPHVLSEMSSIGIDQYLIWGGELDDLHWRKFTPNQLIQKVEQLVHHRIGI